MCLSKRFARNMYQEPYWKARAGRSTLSRLSCKKSWWYLACFSSRSEPRESSPPQNEKYHNSKGCLSLHSPKKCMVLAKSVTNYLVNKYSDSCENKGLLKKTANIGTPNLEEDRHFSCRNSNPSWPAKLIYVGQPGALQPNAPESLHQYGKPAHIINANSVHGQVSSVLNTAKSATTILCNSFPG